MSKIGKFLFFIGLILLVVFFAMDQSKHPAYGYFCVGAVTTFLGGLLMMRGQRPPAESMRFRTLRKWRNQMKERKENKEDQKPY